MIFIDFIYWHHKVTLSRSFNLLMARRKASFMRRRNDIFLGVATKPWAPYASELLTFSIHLPVKSSGKWESVASIDKNNIKSKTVYAIVKRDVPLASSNSGDRFANVVVALLKEFATVVVVLLNEFMFVVVRLRSTNRTSPWITV
jgi:hypothetical protein